MKGIVLVPVILGVGLLAVGGTLAMVAFTNSKKEAPVTTTHEIEETFDKIDIDVSISDVEFVVSADEKQKVVCEETEEVMHDVKVEDHTLKVKYEDKRPWYETWFNWSFTKRSVTVYLSSLVYDDVTVHTDTGVIDSDISLETSTLRCDTSTGRITLANIKSEKMSVTASTGDISVSTSKMETLNVKTSTGRITLREDEASKDITLKSSTGDIKAESVKGESLDSQCSTGNVNFKDVIINKHMGIKTSTGNIRLEDCDAETLTLKSDTGSIKGNLLTSKDFYANSDLGKVTVPHSTTGGRCEIETDTGDINITVNE